VSNLPLLIVRNLNMILQSFVCLAALINSNLHAAFASISVSPARDAPLGKSNCEKNPILSFFSVFLEQARHKSLS